MSPLYYRAARARGVALASVTTGSGCLHSARERVA
jgi:hypothetical protein